ncbi:unnamed protein product [Parnassius apollo]|uniref:(apollo) hypothetical protein n=1 Tax=Parnassius apollo TaxID=110799 RepID=A0A8S3WN70_PARAO|nr:unnamed protein product [Parnassius apollo]CAG4971361.1 unnamed protein product [Parnassius apollo]
MVTLPEIAEDIVNKTLAHANDDNSRTIFLVGSKSVGKSTLLNSFLEKTDTPRETLVLEYSYGRKSNQKQGIEKTICHVWEYGDYSDCTHFEEIIIIGGKYDLFKNYDSEIKKLVCETIRSVALINDAHILFYSSKEPLLVRKAKEILHNAGFGNGVVIKEKNTNNTKPLSIPKGSDSWESIAIPRSTMEQVKMRHVTRIQLEVEIQANDKNELQRTHPEPILDSLAALKYEEIRNMELFDPAINDYLMCL